MSIKWPSKTWLIVISVGISLFALVQLPSLGRIDAWPWQRWLIGGAVFLLVAVGFSLTAVQPWDGSTAPETSRARRYVAGVGWVLVLGAVTSAVTAFYRIDALMWQKGVLVAAGIGMPMLVALFGVSAAWLQWKPFPSGLVVGSAAFLGTVGTMWGVLIASGFYAFTDRVVPATLLPPASMVVSTDSAMRGFTAALPPDPNRGALLAWIDANLHFDSLTHGQADRNRLDNQGLRGLIVPEAHLNNTEHDELVGAAGRFLWLIRIAGDHPYRPLGLDTGRYYVFADSLRIGSDTAVRDYAMQYVREHAHDMARKVVEIAMAREPVGVEPITLRDTALITPRPETYGPRANAILGRVVDSVMSGGAAGYLVLSNALGLSHDTPETELVGIARVLFIPATASAPVVARRLIVKKHLGYWWNRPVARWTGPGHFHPWGDCGSHGCCES